MRTTIYLSGCPHHCPGCHNPDAQDPNAGQIISDDLVQEIADNISIRPFLSGVTLSGGDPFFNPKATYFFITRLLENCIYSGWEPALHPTLWIYTGYTWESLIVQNDICINALLRFADVLVDGPFVQDCADKSLSFRGSSNQRIIDTRKSFSQGKAILYKKE